jgi:hypothetical protein
MSFAFAPSDSSTGLTDFVELADRSAPMRPLPTDQSLEVLRKLRRDLQRLRLFTRRFRSLRKPSYDAVH